MLRDGAQTPIRARHRIQTPGGVDNDLLLMPSWRVGGKIGVKMVTVRGDAAAAPGPTVQAIYIVADAVSGAIEAVLDGQELTLRRTAATSALAARHLAAKGARRLLLVGTGVLAPYLAEAQAVCGGLDAIVVWGRRAEKAEAVALDLATRLNASVSVAADLEAAVAAADIVSCATTARDPIVRGAWLRPGQHLDLVGGFTAEMREVDDAAILRAKVFVDDRTAALAEAGDLIQPLRAGLITGAHIQADLAELVRGEHPGRVDQAEITLFKSVGLGLEDLAAAMLVLKARARPAANPDS
jgi:ornithine cyclodeaminase